MSLTVNYDSFNPYETIFYTRNHENNAAFFIRIFTPNSELEQERLGLVQSRDGREDKYKQLQPHLAPSCSYSHEK